MPSVHPLRGVRYAASVVGNLNRVVTPPYDVISSDEQAVLYRRSPCNFVRVIYGRGRRTDRPGHDRYTRARETFRTWLREGVLRTDRLPGCYPYRQRFQSQGRPYDRWGLIGLIMLGEPTIVPHEETYEPPKQDRLQLLQAVQANLSPIFGLVSDADRRYRELLMRWAARPPLIHVTYEGIQHDVWRVTAPAMLQRLQQAVEAKAMLLADGHHRYEVAMAYRDDVRRHDSRFQRNHPANFMLAYVAAFGPDDPGLLPTHRVFSGLNGWTVDRLAGAGAPWLSVERAQTHAAMEHALTQSAAHGRPAVGCYAAGQWAVAALTRPEEAVALDVELLHRMIVPRMLTPSSVAYVQEWEEAVRRVDREEASVAWYLRSPGLEQIIRRVRSGRLLPQKSTFFSPKPLAGLVIHRLQPVGVPPAVPSARHLA